MNFEHPVKSLIQTASKLPFLEDHKHHKIYVHNRHSKYLMAVDVELKRIS